VEELQKELAGRRRLYLSTRLPFLRFRRKLRPEGTQEAANDRRPPGAVHGQGPWFSISLEKAKHEILLISSSPLSRTSLVERVSIDKVSRTTGLLL